MWWRLLWIVRGWFYGGWIVLGFGWMCLGFCFGLVLLCWLCWYICLINLGEVSLVLGWCGIFLVGCCCWLFFVVSMFIWVCSLLLGGWLRGWIVLVCRRKGWRGLLWGRSCLRGWWRRRWLVCRLRRGWVWGMGRRLLGRCWRRRWDNIVGWGWRRFFGWGSGVWGRVWRWGGGWFSWWVINFEENGVRKMMLMRCRFCLWIIILWRGSRGWGGKVVWVRKVLGERRGWWWWVGERLFFEGGVILGEGEWMK